MKRSIFVFLSLLVAVSFVLTACQTPTEAPTVEETEVVATEEPTETEPTEMVYEAEPFGENLPMPNHRHTFGCCISGLLPEVQPLLRRHWL